MGDGYDYRYNPPRLKADSSYRDIQIGEKDGVNHTISIDLEFVLGDF